MKISKAIEQGAERGLETRRRTGKVCLYCGGFAIARNCTRTNYGWWRRYFCKNCGARFTLRTLSSAAARECRAEIKRKKIIEDEARAARERAKMARIKALEMASKPLRRQQRRLYDLLPDVTTPALRTRLLSAKADDHERHANCCD